MMTPVAGFVLDLAHARPGWLLDSVEVYENGVTERSTFVLLPDGVEYDAYMHGLDDDALEELHGATHAIVYERIERHGIHETRDYSVNLYLTDAVAEEAWGWISRAYGAEYDLGQALFAT